MGFELSNTPGGHSDIEEFLGREVNIKDISKELPLESQGILDSLEVMQFIIFLEKKYYIRLTKDQLNSINIYSDLIKILNSQYDK